MKEVKAPNPIVSEVLGRQSYSADKAYRLLGFCMPVEVADGYLLFNGLTKALVHLTVAEYQTLETMPELVEKWFLVPKDTDDIRFCDQLRMVLYSIGRKSPDFDGFNSYTILTTTGCNARCFYCYEKGMAAKTMTVETAEKVVRFIADTHCSKESVLLRWFGGEPLFNAKAIDTICAGLKSRNIPYRSSMISNGYLFDEDMVRKASNDWNLKNVQITLDGTEKQYNRIKAYIYKGVNAYRRVIDNINLLQESGVKVSIRLNVDKHNVDDLKALIPELDHYFKGSKNVKIYATPIFPPANLSFYSKEHEEEKGRLVLEINRILSEYGTVRPPGIGGLVPRGCMATTAASVMISPEGFLGKCEHYGDSHFFGHIDSSEVDEEMKNLFSERAPLYEGCRTCAAYPSCFRLKMCVSRAYDLYGCVPSRRILRLESFRLTCLQIYEAWKTNQPADHLDEDEENEMPDC